LVDIYQRFGGTSRLDSQDGRVKFEDADSVPSDTLELTYQTIKHTVPEHIKRCGQISNIISLMTVNELNFVMARQRVFLN
jgi:hypothetical protein